MSEWAQVLETGLRLDLPWRTLRPHLVRLVSDGRVEYQSCFEDMEPGIPLVQVRKTRVESSQVTIIATDVENCENPIQNSCMTLGA